LFQLSNGWVEEEHQFYFKVLMDYGFVVLVRLLHVTYHC
jgi:hypothetical protein